MAASRDAWATDALVRREPGELYALRHEIPLGGPQAGPVQAWVERLDPDTLAVTAATPRLPGGPFWPGGIAAHRNGSLYMVFGCWAHMLSPELEVLASHRLPVERPHNSFVVLNGGELVMKDCDAPARAGALDGVGARPRDAAPRSRRRCAWPSPRSRGSRATARA